MTTLQELERRNPEWRPWLAKAGELLAELENRRWDEAVPALMPPAGELDAPLAARAGLQASEAPIPLLHACRRRWSEAVPSTWSHGHCPVCGGWPAFAELCGVERSRFLRCVRCGAAWHAHTLCCAYCGNKDHDALGSLVPQQGPQRASRSWAIEVCRRCRGYLKAFTVLQPSAGERLLLADLETIELDLAAEQRGYRRPERAPAP